MIVYQILTRLFGNKTRANIPNGSYEENGSAKMNDIDEKVLRFISYMGVSHVWYTGIIRQATQTDFSKYGIPRQHPDVVKGKAGSPYAITDYYDVSPELATDVEHRMAEFEALVARTHQAGLKVIIDFVPNHVARQYQSIAKPSGVKGLGEADNPNEGFSPSNNFYYCTGQEFVAPESSGSGERGARSEICDHYQEFPAKATGNDCFTNAPGRNDWYETVKLNYGVDYYAGRVGHFDPIPDTWQKMLDILLFWTAKGVDGFRCDMVFMVPVEFWQWAIPQVKSVNPDIVFVGEIYDPAIYRSYIAAGFDYLYDKVGMYDCVRGVICGYRRAADITWQWQTTNDISDHMLYFLENHDEQRLASDFFAHDGRRGLPGVLVSALLQKNPFMLYAGQEFGERGMDAEGFSGQDGRTTIFDYWHLESIHHGYFNRRKLTAEEKALMLDYQKILLLKQRERAIREGEMFDLMYVNQHIGDRQFAFLRKAANELLLVVANFSGVQAEVGVTIPRHAFSHLDIPEGEQQATDLLTGEKTMFCLQADCAVHTTVAPWLGRVYQIKLKKSYKR